MRVLVVEDDPDLCELIDVTLTKQGFEVTSTYTAVEAKTLMTESIFDFVILDLVLPDAADAAKIAESMTSASGKPQVVLTSGKPLQPVSAKYGPKFRYLQKPFSEERLLAVLT